MRFNLNGFCARVACSCLSFLGLFGSASALEFGYMGQVSGSMGGAGVALKNSAWGIYYNPALLGADRRSKFAYSFGAQIKEQNLLEVASIDFDELSKITAKLGDKLLKGGAVAGGAFVIPSFGGNGEQKVDGVLGDALGGFFGITPSTNGNTEITADIMKNTLKDIGLVIDGSNGNTNLTNETDLSKIGDELIRQIEKSDTDTLQKNLQNRLGEAASAAGAPPILTEIIKNADPKGIANLVQSALDGKPLDMDKVLQSVGSIKIARGTDSDIDKLLDAFETLNRTLDANDVSINSQNGLVIQIGGREPTRQLEVDGIGEVSVTESDNGRGALAVAVMPQVFASFSANIDEKSNKLIIEVGNGYIQADIGGGGIDLRFLTDITDDKGNITKTAKQQFDEQSIMGANANHQLLGTMLALIEVPVAYGHTFFTPLGYVNVGASAKMIQAFAYRYDKKVNFKKVDIEAPAVGDMTSMQTFGVDVGALWTPFFARKLNIGLVAKNINAPGIKMNTGADVVLNRQFRAGISYEFLDFLTFALDYDLLPNNTLSVNNPKSQMIGGGILADFKAVDFRIGAMKDLKSKAGEGAILTAGLNLLGFFDVMFQYGLGKSADIYGFNISNYMAVKLGGQFSF